MKAIVWSKDSCSYCEQAKSLLKLKNIDIEERNLSSGDWSKEQLLEAAPQARTVPQIVIDDILIGGFTELREYLKGV